MDRQEALLPCPFCSEKERVCAMPDADDEVLVTCQNCEASAWIDVWNTRPDSPAKYVPEPSDGVMYCRPQMERDFKAGWDAANASLLEAADRMRDCAESYADALHEPDKRLQQQLHHDVVMAIASYDAAKVGK